MPNKTEERKQMTGDQDYYQILGLVPDAEPAVIRAAYRALSSIYHPDRNGTKEGEEKIRLINKAYETLSDAAKKSEYDACREQRHHDATYSDFEHQNPFSSNPVEKAWEIACEFHNHIDKQARDLERISWKLGFAFKLELLETKQYEKCSAISRRLKHEYLSRYFGDDKDILVYAEEIIKARNKPAALYLNQIARVMGDSVSIYKIKERVESRFKDLADLLEKRRIYAAISGSNTIFDVAMAVRLAELHGGTAKHRFFSSRIDATIDGETLRFESEDNFCEYIQRKYSTYA
jgi:curved DNA-binding protein CbpA